MPGASTGICDTRAIKVSKATKTKSARMPGVLRWRLLTEWLGGEPLKSNRITILNPAGARGSAIARLRLT